MRIDPKTILATGLLSLAIVTSAWCCDDAVKRKKEEVPAVVLAALEKTANGISLSDFEKEQKHHQAVSTAEFKGADGKEMEVAVSADGQVPELGAAGDEQDGKK